MLLYYKGAKGGGGFTGATVYWKQETEINNIHKFVDKFLGDGDMSKLPSGLTQVRDMMKLYVIWLWKIKHPVSLLYDCCYACSLESSVNLNIHKKTPSSCYRP